MTRLEEYIGSRKKRNNKFSYKLEKKDKTNIKINYEMYNKIKAMLNACIIFSFKTSSDTISQEEYDYIRDLVNNITYDDALLFVNNNIYEALGHIIKKNINGDNYIYSISLMELIWKNPHKIINGNLSFNYGNYDLLYEYEAHYPGRNDYDFGYETMENSNIGYTLFTANFENDFVYYSAIYDGVGKDELTKTDEKIEIKDENQKVNSNDEEIINNKGISFVKK